MSTRHLIDPELIALLDGFPATDLTADQLPTMRARQAQAALMAEIAPGVEVGEVHSAPYETSPGARMRTYRPKGRSDRLPVYLHIHGGGYVSGSPEGSGTRNSQLANELGCIVASVDYRLAPEWPYPNALHDCSSAL